MYWVKKRSHDAWWLLKNMRRHQGFFTRVHIFFFLFSKMNPSKLYVTEWEFKCFTFSERIHTRKLRHWRRILFRFHAHRLLLQPDFHCTFMQFEYACAKGSTWATTIRIYYYVTTVERKKIQLVSRKTCIFLNYKCLSKIRTFLWILNLSLHCLKARGFFL